MRTKGMHWGKGLVLLFLVALLAESCRKDISYSSDPGLRLSFSEDTIYFDTVFTSIGSITKRLKIYNPHNEAVLISEIRVGGGNQSLYRINVNGNSGNVQRDIELLPNDSIYVFAEVTLDPLDQNQPLIVEDSLLIFLNGNEDMVRLVAWGQDAYFHYPDKSITVGNTTINYSIIDCNANWIDDKPHVIYGYAVVDETCQLTMNPGTKLHMHKDAVLWVFDGGTLKIDGDFTNEVVIQGDRLEPSFEEIPGQWGAIWLSAGSFDNEIEWAIIKNGTVGLRVDTLGASAVNLKISNTVIRNMSSVGLLGQGTVIEGENLAVYNCGQHCLVLNIGGSYVFNQGTFGNYWTFGNRQTTAVLMRNYYEDIDQNIIVRPIEQAEFRNCIIYGNLPNEVAWDKIPNTDLDFQFRDCLIRVVKDDWKDVVDFGDVNYFENCTFNNSPNFVDPQLGNYQLDTLSTAKDIGNSSWAGITPLDLLEVSRFSDAGPDLGAYEREE